MGFTAGLVATAFLFGFRHGFDWDHIAAITDITSSQESSRRALTLSTVYALGHAGVVLVLGVVAIAAGDFIPETVDETMGRVVGATLIALGIYVFYSLLKHGRDFQMRSRWMLVLAGIRRLVRGRAAPPVVVEHTHEHFAGHGHHDHGGDHDGAEGTVTHSHRHRHIGPPGDPFMSYGAASAAGIGAIHGVGAETPTQILVFIAAAGAGGAATGVAVLIAFVVGMLGANTLVALASMAGFLRAGRSFPVYAAIAIATGVFSLALGALLLFARGELLPELFA